MEIKFFNFLYGLHKSKVRIETIISFKMWPVWYVRGDLITQIKNLYFKEGLDTYHIGERKITFITEFTFMTYDHYVNMPKQMVGRNLIEKVHGNPRFIWSLQKMPKPILNE